MISTDASFSEGRERELRAWLLNVLTILGGTWVLSAADTTLYDNIRLRLAINCKLTALLYRLYLPRCPSPNATRLPPHRCLGSVRTPRGGAPELGSREISVPAAPCRSQSAPPWTRATSAWWMLPGAIYAGKQCELSGYGLPQGGRRRCATTRRCRCPVAATPSALALLPSRHDDIQLEIVPEPFTKEENLTHFQ